MMLAADSADASERPGQAGGSGVAFGIEQIGDLVVGEMSCELAQAVGDGRGGGHGQDLSWE